MHTPFTGGEIQLAVWRETMTERGETTHNLMHPYTVEAENVLVKNIEKRDEKIKGRKRLETKKLTI